MKNENINFYIVSKEHKSFQSYELLLSHIDNISINYCNFEEFLSLCVERNNSIFLVDIATQLDVVYLKDIVKNKTSKLIFLTPFEKNFLHFSSTLDANVDYIVLKPLNLKKLISIINICIYSISQISYLKTKEKLLSLVIDNSPLRVAVFDIEGQLTYANSNYLRVNNIDKIGEDSYFEDFTKCDMEFKTILQNLKKHPSFTIEREQDKVWNKSVFYHIDDNSKVVHVCSDITEDKNTIHQLKRASMFFDQSNEGMMIVSTKGIILAVNRAFCTITGYTMEEAVGKTPKLLNSGVHEEDFYQNLWENLQFNGQWQGEIWNKRKSGEIYPQWLSIAAVEDSYSKEKTYITMFTDISSIKEADKKLNFYANHDHLTGLLNRVQFENLFNNLIERAKRNNKIFALLFIDLDGFKEVNDTYGHNIGDILLKVVANILRKNVRKEDVIARIGGDEFNILLEDIKSKEEAIEVANKLRVLAKEPIIIENKSFFISFSIGASIYPTDGITSTELSKNADSAMYQVKDNGRDGVLLYDTSFNKELQRKFTIQNELKLAIEKKELEVYYQPVYDMQTATVVGAEALARWNHKKLGFIPPDEFIKVAEDSGSIISLGALIQDIVFHDLQTIRNFINLDNFTMAINVSSREFFHNDFIEQLVQKTEDFFLTNSNIELEITETHIMKNHELAIGKFKQLKEHGFKLAIDDFGTGYSSLSYLKDFPIDKLKIDQSFIFTITKNDDDLKIVKAIIYLAKGFSLQTQAEGVETQEHVELLKKLGCDIAQGYHFAKPLIFQDFLERLKETK